MPVELGPVIIAHCVLLSEADMSRRGGANVAACRVARRILPGQASRWSVDDRIATTTLAQWMLDQEPGG
ncbi:MULTISPECIES: hypothetical protein [Rhodopseudomonas]|uniref:hypothetical protein n=1 Tax=Rhodopseudomonas TaxID=1073 RepID=UPI00156861D2|nr:MULTISPECIES: hypothetical protein [Rhodopseudomonas]MDF3809964.1 hypothetical protein [Rhodopseudomonas sp. BAL398]WOK20881.1 hypothetical protein RBJ75_13560 [Rhodopseudomonas sp. BAL398]